jgi:serine/threonine-protein kinase RsbW
VHIKVAMTLPRAAVSVPLARRTVRAALRSVRVAPECVQESELAVSEACTNVYRHAGVGDHYEVVIRIADDELTIDILDSGAGITDGHLSPTMPDGTAENGRGLFLMTALTDRAVFDADHGSGGSVHLMKRLRWDADRPTTVATSAD